jgi:hypothetical protein
MKPHSTTNSYFWLLAILLPVLFKIWPGASHYNPQIVLACYLSATSNKYKALIGVLSCAIISDLASGYVSTYGVWGTWTWFTYSAWIAIVLSASCSRVSPSHCKWMGITISASVAFWLWTNLGVWLTSKMYGHTLVGLLHCYVLAVPFLEYSILSALLWSSLMVGFNQLTAMQKALR